MARNGASEAVSQFADRTSMHGVPSLIRAKSRKGRYVYLLFLYLSRKILFTIFHQCTCLFAESVQLIAVGEIFANKQVQCPCKCTAAFSNGETDKLAEGRLIQTHYQIVITKTLRVWRLYY